MEECTGEGEMEKAKEWTGSRRSGAKKGGTEGGER